MLLDYDLRKLRELLLSFYTLTGIRIVVFDADFRPIAEYPQGDGAFCRLIRQHPEEDRRCAESDRRACEQSRAQNGLYTYTCHAGLSESVAPIRHGNIVIGYMMLGQVRLRMDDERQWADIRAACAGRKVDESALRAAFDKMPPVAMEQVRASAVILEACAGYLWLSRMISLKENSLPRQLYEYIEQHLHEDLSSAHLCEVFRISRSRLYRVSSEFFHCGIEELVRTTRVARAREYLEQTRDSVTDIAHRVGYPDYNYFIKVFKAYTGDTPARYRKARQ